MLEQMQVMDEHDQLFDEFKAEVSERHVADVASGCTCSTPRPYVINFGKCGHVDFDTERKTDPDCPLHGYE